MFDIKKATIKELEERKAAIATEVDAEGADLDALEKEARDINAEIELRKAAQKKREEVRGMVAAGAGSVITRVVGTPEKVEKSDEEIRKSPEYVEAFARYIKTEDDSECRALLSQNAASGTVPVPAFVYDTIKTAWESEGIAGRVRKSYLRGNVKVGFEISGDDAVVHEEGSAAINPENLVLGVVELVPKSIKKVVQISDEAYDLGGEAFLDYIYREVAHRIAKKAADVLVGKILDADDTSSATAAGVPEVEASTLAVGTVAEAMAHLSDEAVSPVIIMNKLTWGAIKAVQYNNKYSVDPFEGLPVVFNDSIKAYSAATTGEAYMVVGDLENGALMNFPNGEEIKFKFDELSLKKQDLVEVLGRQFVGIGVIAPNAFVKVIK